MLTLFSRCPMYRGLVLQSLGLLRNAVTSYPFLSIEFFFKLLKEENLNIEEIIPPQPQVTDRGEREREEEKEREEREREEREREEEGRGEDEREEEEGGRKERRRYSIHVNVCEHL